MVINFAIGSCLIKIRINFKQGAVFFPGSYVILIDTNTPIFLSPRFVIFLSMLMIEHWSSSGKAGINAEYGRRLKANKIEECMEVDICAWVARLSK